MSELWSEQKKYIDASAKYEACKVAAIVLIVLFVVVTLYAGRVYKTTSELAQLDKRVKVLEEGR